MGTLLGTILAGVGLLFAAAALLGLMVTSGLTGGPTAGTHVLAAAGAFLVSLFTFGYGVGTRTTGRV